MRAVKKIDRIREDLGNVGPVIAERVEKAMLGHESSLDTRQAEENSPARRLHAFERKQREKLQEQIHQLYQQLQEGKRELELTSVNIQAVVETALEIARQPALQRRTLHDPYGHFSPIEVFDVPELSGSWARCTNGLEHPHTHQKRPIVFDHDLARGRDDVVLAHLNHRLVTMPLRLLRAEVWTSGDQRKLYRVTARTVPSHMLDTPAVIAHARLLMLGGDNQRLHEEVIAAGGYLREGRFARMNERQLREVLSAAQNHTVAEGVRQRLAELWDKYRLPLMQSLEVRMNEREQSLQRALADRAVKEQRDIQAILTELQASILKEIQRPAQVVQLQLAGFSSEERQQFDRDVAALEDRVRQIDTEIAEETRRIQQRFANPQSRLFPVAVTYLVPERLAR